MNAGIHQRHLQIAALNSNWWANSMFKTVLSPIARCRNDVKLSFLVAYLLLSVGTLEIGDCRLKLLALLARCPSWLDFTWSLDHSLFCLVYETRDILHKKKIVGSQKCSLKDFCSKRPSTTLKTSFFHSINVNRILGNGISAISVFLGRYVHAGLW